MKNNYLLSLAILLFLALDLSAQSDSEYPNLMHLDSSQSSPTATLSDVAWIQGHWRGEAFGGITEEIWSPPLGNSMMCAFKLVVEGQVRFYEIVTLTEEQGTLMLRLKHFHGDLKGWEEKEETMDFPLVKVSPGKVFFDGFTFEQVSNDEMNIYVLLEDGAGNKKEEVFRYERVDAK